MTRPPKVRRYILAFTSDTNFFELEIPPNVSLDKLKEILTPGVYGNNEFMIGESYKLSREDLRKIGFTQSLPEAEYFLESDDLTDFFGPN